MLWLPISFGVATFVHAVLIAKALSLPAWMQLLHPVATVIAKTKLLVLPVYPAAWPQAKQHPLMQALIRFWHFVVAHYFARKIGYRYRQTEVVAAATGDALRHTAAATGLSRLGSAVVAGVNAAAAWIGSAAWRASSRTVASSHVSRCSAESCSATPRTTTKRTGRRRSSSANARADFFSAGRSSSRRSITRTRNAKDAAKGVAGA